MHQSSVFHGLKSDERGQFEGIAWSFEHAPDPQGDVFLPSSFKGIKAPLPLLFEHQPNLKVGEIYSAWVEDRGLMIAGQITDAQAREKALGEYQGLSIGFNGKGEKSGALRVITAAEVVEVSICKKPMNRGSWIEQIKSLPEVKSEIELAKIFKQRVGMPGRLASKSAAACWPFFSNYHDDTAPDFDPEAEAALARILSAKY